jgi:hypothetical protein
LNLCLQSICLDRDSERRAASDMGQ